MRALFFGGLVLLVLGLVSLFVAFPQRERHGMNAGGVSVAIETQHSQKLPPLISAVLILGGAGMMVASQRRA